MTENIWLNGIMGVVICGLFRLASIAVRCASLSRMLHLGDSHLCGVMRF